MESELVNMKGMTKIVVNDCYGGFSLSDKALVLAKSLAPDDKAWKKATNHPYLIPRHDPILVRIVEELGKEANGTCANLVIELVQSGSLYRIDEYNGKETVMRQEDYHWERAP